MKTLHRFAAVLVAACALLMGFTRTAAAEVATRASFAVGHCYTAVDYGFSALRRAADSLLLWSGMHWSLLHAGAVGDLTPVKRAAELERITKEAQKLQEDHRGKAMPPEVGEKFAALCAEGKVIQDEIDREKALDSMEGTKRYLREIPDPALPADRDAKGSSGVDVAGYMSVSDFVIASPEFQQFAKNEYARGSHAVIQLGAALLGKNVVTGPRGEPMVALTREQRKAIQERIESKAIPTLGTGVVEVERLARIPQVTVDDKLTLRSVIDTGTTGAGSVEYVREEALTGSAAETTHGAAKPELGLEYTLQTAPVRTIAGWIPVQNQQLEDWPQLRSLIDGRLRYSVKRREDYQLVWGNGTPPNLEGLLTVSGTNDIEANGRYNASDHTLIDVIRMGITDVRVAGYEPNFVAAHPYDWESIVLMKGTDDRYVWAVVTDANGTRIWGLQVVESVAMQQRAGVATERREILVGDGRVGAQILDRMQSTVMVGLVDDQFIKNMRTVLAEERLAFPIYAPAAFAHFETQAAAT
jgi:HK97 family phage major capsid protein